MISTFIHIHSHELIQIIVTHIHEFTQYNCIAYRDSLPSYTVSNASQDLLQIILIHFTWFHKKFQSEGF